MDDPKLAVIIQNLPGNMLSTLQTLKQQMEEAQAAEGPQAEEITQGRVSVFDLGLAPANGVETTDPTDAAFTGVFICGDGIVFNGKLYHFGGVNLGQLMAGFSELTGAMEFLGGLAVIDNTGILVTLAGPVIRSTVGLRTGSLVMDLLPGETLYSALLRFFNDGGGVELVTDGTFPSLTNWVKTTETNGAWTASGNQAIFTATTTNPAGTLTQRIAVSAGVNYNMTIKARGVSCNGNVNLKWYDAAIGGNLLRTDVLGTLSSAYQTFANTYLSPAGAAGVDINLNANPAASVGGYVEFGNASLQVTGVSGLIGFEPIAGDPIAQKGAVLGRLAVGDRNIHPSNYVPTFAAAAGGAVNAGTHYYRFVFTDAYGKTTLGGPTGGILIVNPNNTVNISDIPLGPAGTLTREIYRTAANQADIITNHKLLGTIPDNVTTTYTDNKADSALGADAPAVNTTGSRPVWGTHWHIFAEELVSAVTRGTTLASVRDGYYYGPSAANANNGDEYFCNFELEASASAYTFSAYGWTDTDCGNVDYYIDGALAETGQSWYAAAGAAAVKTFSFTNSTPGIHHLMIKVNGKHGSSSDYRLLLTKLWITPTQD